MKNGKRSSVPAREAVPDWVEDEFRRNREWLLAEALRLSRNPAQAEELTQEVFTRMAAASPRMVPFPTEIACRSWLLKVLRRVLVDRYRKEAAREDRSTDPMAEHLQPRELPDDLRPDRRLALELVGQAASELPAGLAATFELYSRGMGHDEMAWRLKIKPNALRKRLHGMRCRVTQFVLSKLKARGANVEEMAELLTLRESKVREHLEVHSRGEDE